MPIYNTKDLVPFVNILENKIAELNESITSWNANKYEVLASAKKVDATQNTAIIALVRADEAMAEIGTATFKSTSNRGKRLEDTLNKLREEMYDIASSVEGSGGGGALTDGIFFDELNNAISSVDATVEDGLKLDYRLREIADKAASGSTISTKELFMPYKIEHESLDRTFYFDPLQDIELVDAEVTVLNGESEPFVDDYGRIVTGTIKEDGLIELSAATKEKVYLYFPVRMKLADIPEDFLYLFMNQIIQKNSRIMEVVLNFEGRISAILSDIEEMKGVRWTPDFSIMRNHQDIVKEGITPKGLSVEVKDGLAHVTFSHNDHESLSHFVLEKWDEAQKKFVPYDGVAGIVQK